MADDNMSTDAADDEELKLKKWKKIVNRLKRLSAKDARKIKEIVLAAIAAAREAHNLEALNGLREALLEYRPDGAGLCLKMALDLLEKQGGYDDEGDDDEEENEDGSGDGDNMVDLDQDDEEEGDPFSTCLSGEAVVLNSCLDGNEYPREAWIDSLRNAKTLSRLAALVNAFTKKANEKIQKMEAENQNLYDLIDALSKGRKKAGSADDASEVWTNVKYTDDFCLAKVAQWPHWPARKCLPKDESLASQLESLDRVLVSLVSESGALRIVPSDSVLPFSETLPEETDLSLYTNQTRAQMENSMAIARRIVRGLAKKKTGKR